MAFKIYFKISYPTSVYCVCVCVRHWCIWILEWEETGGQRSRQQSGKMENVAEKGADANGNKREAKNRDTAK